jgi:hypothetical protein
MRRIAWAVPGSGSPWSSWGSSCQRRLCPATRLGNAINGAFSPWQVFRAERATAAPGGHDPVDAALTSGHPASYPAAAT